MDIRADVADTTSFAPSREQLGAITAWLASEEAMTLDHATLERELLSKREELLAQVLQDYQKLRFQDEAPLPRVVDAEHIAPDSVQ